MTMTYEGDMKLGKGLLGQVSRQAGGRSTALTSPRPASADLNHMLSDIVRADFKEELILSRLNVIFHGRKEAMIDHIVTSLNTLSDRGDAKQITPSSFMRRFTHAVKCNRKFAMLATNRFISLDTELRPLVLEADARRDEGNWAGGEAGYYDVLQIYPYSGGYFVQYGHCLKEQGKFDDAELAYRTAWSYGEVTHDLIEHISFVSHQGGRRLNLATFEAIRHYWTGVEASSNLLDAPPARADVTMLFNALLGRTQYTFGEIFDVMNSSPTIVSIIESIIKMPEFVTANRDLMPVIVESKDNIA